MGRGFAIGALAGLALTIALSGCNSCRRDDAEASVGDAGNATLPHDDVVLARVGEAGEPISAWDLDFAAEQALGNLADVALDGSTREEILESAITSRAIAQLREAELSSRESAELDKRVAAYRERLLVEGYLAVHAEVREVPEEELRAYYDAHPEKYGSKPQRSFELAFVELGSDPTSRGSLLQELSKVRDAADWREGVAEAQGRGLPLGFRRGDVELASLPPRLRDSAVELEAGEETNLIMLGSRAYVLRVTSVGRRAGKSFREVRGRIAQILRPRATRDAILSIQKQVLDQVKVLRGGA